MFLLPHYYVRPSFQLVLFVPAILTYVHHIPFATWHCNSFMYGFVFTTITITNLIVFRYAVFQYLFHPIP